METMETNENYTFFPTAMGVCALAWNEKGVTALSLPEKNLSSLEKKILTEARLRGKQLKKIPVEKVEKKIRQWIRPICDHLEGRCSALTEIPLDFETLPPFFTKVYQTLRGQVGPGKTITYGELGKKCQCPKGARAVGQAMRKNPFPLLIPCHRVLRAGGKGGGFSAYGGLSTKEKLLSLESGKKFQLS